MQANMHEAKSKLSQLVESAVNGEQVLIAKAGKPIVKLVPYKALPQRTFGQFKGEAKMATDFDSKETNTEIEGLFGV